MFDDPYKVLGVTPDTPPDEIKKAYRRLAKQYHPDLHPDDPECARKMNEINSAYDQINNPQKYQRQQPTGGSGYGYGSAYADPFAGTYGGYQQRQYTYTAYDGSNDPVEFQQAAQFINARHYQAALDVLMTMEQRSRNARWYYLCGMANAGLGNKILALQQLETAVRMDPNNLQYQIAYQQVQSTGQFYRQQNQDFCAMNSNPCAYLCMMNLLCNCCCGGQMTFWYC